MPNWLSITWENDRLLLLTARVQNGSATFERAAALKPGNDARKESPSLKKRLEEFIREHRLAKAETIVLLSRSEVEVRPMLFPPVPVEELPDLVKFQASKEFNGYDGAAPLDFFITNKLDNVSRSTLFPAVRAVGRQKDGGQATPVSTGSPKHLLASTIRGETFRKIRQFCEELNLNLRRVVLRPCEAAYLLRQRKEFNQQRTVLLVELDTTETSQAVLFQGEPVFLRSPKISCPEDVGAADFAARLVAELKRTRIAVRNEIQGVTVDEVVLCGVGRRFEALARQVSEAMEIPVKTFDPWEGLSRSGDLKNPQLESSERFAALLGATVRAGKGESSDIDFCNPKKRPEPVGHRQVVTGVLAACFFLLVCATCFGFYYRTNLADEVKKLSAQKVALDKTAKTVAVERSQLKAIDDWLADDANWFDQLAWLSRNTPPSQDMILNRLTLSANRGGSMTLESLVRDSSVVSPMEERLRDENHDVKTGEKGEFKGNLQYGFRFNLTVFLSKSAGALSEPLPVEPLSVESLPVEPGPTEPSSVGPETVPDEETPNEKSLSADTGNEVGKKEGNDE